MAHIWTEPQKKWLAKLRSGEYKQGERRLHTAKGGDNFYCCLGLVCLGAIEDGIVIPVNSSSMYIWYDNNSEDLSPRLQEYIGMKSSDGHIKPLGLGYSCLTSMNDGCPCQGIATKPKLTFAQIADFIEQHPEELFIQPEQTNAKENTQETDNQEATGEAHQGAAETQQERPSVG